MSLPTSAEKALLQLTARYKPLLYVQTIFLLEL